MEQFQQALGCTCRTHDITPYFRHSADTAAPKLHKGRKKPVVTRHAACMHLVSADPQHEMMEPSPL